MSASASRSANSTSSTRVFCRNAPSNTTTSATSALPSRRPELGPPCGEDVHERVRRDGPVERLTALHRGLHLGPLPGAPVGVDLGVGHGHAGRTDPRAAPQLGLRARVRAAHGLELRRRQPPLPRQVRRLRIALAIDRDPGLRPVPASGPPTGQSSSSPSPGFPQPEADDAPAHRGPYAGPGGHARTAGGTHPTPGRRHGTEPAAVRRRRLQCQNRGTEPKGAS